MGRFISIVQLQQTYNLTFLAMPPVDMQFQIQRGTPLGDPTNFVVICMYYPLPNSIQIQVNKVVIPNIPLTDGGLLRALDTTKCGDNIYYFTNYTIVFVVIESPACLVRVTVVDTIQLTTHFSLANAS